MKFYEFGKPGNPTIMCLSGIFMIHWRGAGRTTFSANLQFASRLLPPLRGIIPDIIMEEGAFMPEDLKMPCNLGLLAHV